MFGSPAFEDSLVFPALNHEFSLGRRRRLVALLQGRVYVGCATSLFILTFPRAGRFLASRS